MLFFLIIQLCFIEHMYQYSLDSFISFVYKAIDRMIDAVQLRQARVEVKQLSAVDSDGMQPPQAGFELTQLCQAAFDAMQPRQAGFDAMQL